MKNKIKILHYKYTFYEHIFLTDETTSEVKNKLVLEGLTEEEYDFEYTHIYEEFLNKCKNFDYIFIDYGKAESSIHITDLEILCKKYPEKQFIIISESTTFLPIIELSLKNQNLCIFDIRWAVYLIRKRIRGWKET